MNIKRGGSREPKKPPLDPPLGGEVFRTPGPRGPWIIDIGIGVGRGGKGGRLAPPTLPTVYIMNFIAETVLHVGIVPKGNHIFVV